MFEIVEYFYRMYENENIINCFAADGDHTIRMC